MPTAIKFENISKQYRLGLVSTRTLSHDLNRWWQINILRHEDPYLKIGEVNDRAHKGASEYVWALKDINFEVEQGDVVGIIGKNGAGKSTLLKILSKVTTPTTGTIKAKGRIASLLEVGTGFHPEMTGRENIYMNGAIMGMARNDINRKFDEIVDFAGVERYIDTPVKRYSSGMTVRLGFAVAAFLEPEILVVDEVLAVGDAEFQKKAIGKMQDVSRGDGRTVLFVSHNMPSIKALCSKGILLQNGNIEFNGNIEDAVDSYLKTRIYQNQQIINSIKTYSNIIQIQTVTINNGTSNILHLQSGDLKIAISIEGSLSAASRIELEAQLFDSNNVLLASYCPGHLSGHYNTYDIGHFKISNEIQLPTNITKGDYFLSIQLTDPNVAFLMNTELPIKLSIEGFVNDCGMNFSYKNRGFLVLS